MRALLFGVFPVVLLLAAVSSGQDAPKSELEGTWRGIRLETKEGNKDDDYAKTIRWTIVGNKITLKEKLITIGGNIKIDAKNRPKTIDVDSKEAIIDFAWAGIYELDGDTLKVCYVLTKDALRPKEFKAKPAILLILKRDNLSPAVAAERKKLEGGWEPVSGESGGKKLSEKHLPSILGFKGDKALFVGSSAEGILCELTLDPSKGPKEIDLKGLLTPDNKVGVMKGIYELKDDALTVCFGPPGEARPTKFSSPDGAKSVLWTLKRKKGIFELPPS